MGQAISASAGIGLGIGLGIDAGGTATRWALAASDGALLAEGVLPGLSALQLDQAAGRASLEAIFADLACAVLAVARPDRVQAGLTGLSGADDAHAAPLAAMLAQPLGLAPAAIALCSDIELACRTHFAPGAGYLVYAGTGSIGAFIDAAGQFHRAGGRGVVLDDGGGGFSIARAALRQIWRREDECPGSWQACPMARAVFDYLGGSDWAVSRQFIHGQPRGAVGQLALAVAASAAQSPAAAAILERAGAELGRLACALINRFGPRPVQLAGRAAQLHPSIPAALRATLPAGTIFTHSSVQAQQGAARLAAGAARP